jgi:hypothetical protein
MNPELQNWMPAILALFGSTMVVLFGAWLNTRSLLRTMEAFRDELKAEIGRSKAEVLLAIARLETRVELLERDRGLIRKP